MTFGFTRLFNVVVNSNLNMHDFAQFDSTSSDVQHNDECHFVVINSNKMRNNFNNINNHPSTTTLTTNGTVGSTTSCSNKVFYDNTQITFGSISITIILFAIIFINWNCVLMDNSQSHYNFIYHYIFVVLLCMVLNRLVLVYFIQTDKIIDIICLDCQNYCCNKESTGESLQVNIDDCIVSGGVFCWYNHTIFIVIEMVYIHAIYSFDAIIGHWCILHCSNYFAMQLISSFNFSLLFFYYIVTALIFHGDAYQLDNNMMMVYVSFIVSFKLKLFVFFALLIGVSPLWYIISNKNDISVYSTYRLFKILSKEYIDAPPARLNDTDDVDLTLNTCQGDNDLILPNNEIYSLIKVYLAVIVDIMDESSSTDTKSNTALANKFELTKITDIDYKHARYKEH